MGLTSKEQFTAVVLTGLLTLTSGCETMGKGAAVIGDFTQDGVAKVQAGANPKLKEQNIRLQNGLRTLRCEGKDQRSLAPNGALDSDTIFASDTFVEKMGGYRAEVFSSVRKSGTQLDYTDERFIAIVVNEAGKGIELCLKEPATP